MAQLAQAQANERRFEIVSGPSKYDLVILALGEGQMVKFRLKDGPKNFVIGEATCYIFSIAREDGSNQSWLITGSIEKPDQSKSFFKAYYHTVRRQGVMFIKD